MSRSLWSLRFPRRNFSLTRFYSSSSNDKIITPWYVEEARKVVAESTAGSAPDNLPPLPTDSPASLAKIVNFAAQDMGLQDLMVIDRRSDDQLVTGALGPSIIVLGTGKSTRHLGSAGMLLLSYLKKEFGVHAGREGILTTNFIRVQNRRQKKRQQRQRTAAETIEPLQKVGPWVAIDTKTDNVYVHLMTAERRAEVDLEHIDLLDEDGDFVSEEDLVSNEEYAEPSAVGQTATGKPGKRSYSTSAAPSPVDSRTREDLALENLVEEKRVDLTVDSEEVRSFVQHFPLQPSREDWKRRLQYFAIATIQSPDFSVERVVEEAQKQQASGYVMDNEDTELLLSAICYHGQAQFARLSESDETLALWEELCELKASLLLKVYDTLLRPQNKSLLGNPRLLTLMFRTFTAMSAQSTTPSAVLINPKPSGEGLGVFADGKRLLPLRYLLETTNEMKDVRTVSMVLTSLANSGMYDAFWKVVDLASVTSNSNEVSELLAEVAVSLIVKSGDTDQIKFAIQSFLPTSILSRKVRLTPNLANVIEAGLETVDNEKTGYKSVRMILEKYREGTTSIPSSA